MKYEVSIEISGLGIVFYSPFAVKHIKPGENFLEANFWDPEDVAKHVNDCFISAFCTGSPGSYILKIFDGEYPLYQIQKASVAIRLGIEVRDNLLVFRDLYDLMEWDDEYSESQAIKIPNGFYKITVFTSFSENEIIGDNQIINMHFEKMSERPKLNWDGVPNLSKVY